MRQFPPRVFMQYARMIMLVLFCMNILFIYSAEYNAENGTDTNAQTLQSTVSLETIKQSLERIYGLDVKSCDKISVLLEQIKAQLAEHPEYISIDKQCSCDAYMQAMETLCNNHDAIGSDKELQELVQAVSVLDVRKQTKENTQDDRAPRPAVGIPGAPLATMPEIVDMPKDITVERDLMVGGNQTVAGNVTVSGSMIIVGPTTCTGNVTLEANLILPNSTTTDGVIYKGSVAVGNQFISNPNSTSTAVGLGSGRLNLEGNYNTMVGCGAGSNLTSGFSNTLYGYGSGATLTTGAGNKLIGVNSGSSYAGGESYNILIGSGGVSGDDHVTRFGTEGSQSKCYIAGIQGKSTDTAFIGTLGIDVGGRLGTAAPSSLKYKKDVEPIGVQSNKILDLNVVSFVYKNDETNTKQYGVIAEEAFMVYPEIVLLDSEGLPDAVQIPYGFNWLMLNEIQKNHRTIAALEARVSTLEGARTYVK